MPGFASNFSDLANSGIAAGRLSGILTIGVKVRGSRRVAGPEPLDTAAPRSAQFVNAKQKIHQNPLLTRR